MSVFTSPRVMVPNILANIVKNLAPVLNLDAVFPAKRPRAIVEQTKSNHYNTLLYSIL